MVWFGCVCLANCLERIALFLNAKTDGKILVTSQMPNAVANANTYFCTMPNSFNCPLSNAIAIAKCQQSECECQMPMPTSHSVALSKCECQINAIVAPIFQLSIANARMNAKCTTGMVWYGMVCCLKVSHAVSQHPEGPFTRQELVAPPEHHNPTLKVSPVDKSWNLYVERSRLSRVESSLV